LYVVPTVKMKGVPAYFPMAERVTSFRCLLSALNRKSRKCAPSGRNWKGKTASGNAPVCEKRGETKTGVKLVPPEGEHSRKGGERARRGTRRSGGGGGEL